MPSLFSGAAMALVFVVSSTAAAQSAGDVSSQAAPQGSQSGAAQAAQKPVPVPGSSVVVTAQKEPADPSTLPVSVTTVTEDLLKAAGITWVSDAGILSPNTQFTEFSARKLSNPRVRGIGASPANPGVMTYVDGVPQFSSNSSSFDLIDVGQVEFVRGPQSALFGRNALGGLINISSGRPSLSKWAGNVALPFGSDGLFDVRATVSGPIQTNSLAAGFTMAYSQRDGFTKNTVTGNDLDSREAFSGKGQLLWTPSAQWETRVIVSGERARDGDYALNDLEALRQNPYEVSRDFEGYTHRDLFSTTALVRREGARVSFFSTTGVVRWKTDDSTDLDYSPMPLATRSNLEEATQFTQEVRFASAAAAPVKLSDSIALRWQAGTLVFTQGYDQNAANTISPYVLSPFIPFTVVQTSPRAALDDVGVGVYGQGTLAFSDRVDVSFGARFDHEQRDADLLTEYTPAIAPSTSVVASRSFTDVSPQAGVAYRARPGTIVFGSVGRAFKAGGFNPIAVPGAESYGEEHAWNIEGGVKASATNGRLSMTASVFAIEWDDLQLNVPVPGAPGQFYISNVGNATSRGAEFEATAQVYNGVDVFGAVGFTRARFSDGTFANGVDVSDNLVPNTPSYTATFGAQITRELQAGGRVYGRAEVACFGAFEYDEANTQRQEAYSVTNLRAGWRGKRLVVEGWIRNAFDTRYIPLAFAYPGFTPSGFIGEPGKPRTFGVSIGVGF